MKKNGFSKETSFVTIIITNRFRSVQEPEFKGYRITFFQLLLKAVF